MATRNLTKKFLEVRNAAKANRHLQAGAQVYDTPDDANLLSKSRDSSGSVIRNDKSSLPPVWVDRVEAIEDQIRGIELKIQELTKMHYNRLKVNFEADEKAQEREIEDKTSEITSLFHSAENKLQKFDKDLNSSVKLSQAELAVRKNIKMSLAKKLQGLTQSFRGSQKQYMQRLQVQKSGSGGAFDFMDEPAKGAGVPSDHGFTSAQMQESENLTELINQRDEEIVKIAKSIEELAAIFKELAVLVIDQGTILDRIDYNMETAVVHAKEGMVHLKKAEEHQKNALSIKCIIVLVILIAIMLGVLIWKHSK